jgi:polyhydroxyalkanoate synthesis regulator phasin
VEESIQRLEERVKALEDKEAWRILNLEYMDQLKKRVVKLEEEMKYKATAIKLPY